MANLDYIPDAGYTEKGYIKAAKPQHGDLRFTFVPMLYEQRRPIVEAAGKSQAQYAIAAGKALAAHVKSWSLKDAKGQPVAPSENVIRRLKPKLLDRLTDIVAGFGVSDVDPNWSDEERDALLSLEAEAEESNELPGEVRTEGDLGNSAAA